MPSDPSKHFRPPSAVKVSVELTAELRGRTEVSLSGPKGVSTVINSDVDAALERFEKSLIGSGGGLGGLE